MGYGIQNLRRAAVYDSMTPGSPSYGNEDNTQIQAPDGSPLGGYEPQDTRILNPDGTPQAEEPTSNGLAKLADLSVDPNKGTEKDRLQDYLNTIQGAYEPNYKSRDRNDNLLDNFPTRGQPTNWDRTAAILMSLGQKDPAAIQEKVLQAPYYRDREEWKEKSEPFYKAAQLEGLDNNNTRQILGNAATTFSTNERTRVTQEKNQQQYDLGLQRNNILKFKAENPDWKIDLTGPTGWAIDPQDPNNKINLGPTGHMSDLEKITMQGKTARDVATIRAGATTGAAQIRANAAGGAGTGRPTGTRVGYDEEGDAFYWDKVNNQWADETKQGKRPVGIVRPVGTSGADSPGNQKIDYRLNMEKIYTRNEDGAQEFMVPNSMGGYTIKKRPEPGMWSGDVSAKQAQYDRLMKKIDPEYVPPGGVVPIPNHQGPPGVPTTIPNHNPGEEPKYLPQGASPAATANTSDPGKRQRAANFLKEKGQKVTPQNIEHTIRMGWVE